MHHAIMGETFSVADAYLFTVLNWAKPMGFDLSKWPGLEAYVAQFGERPKVTQAMNEEGLLK